MKLIFITLLVVGQSISFAADKVYKTCDVEYTEVQTDVIIKNTAVVLNSKSPIGNQKGIHNIISTQKISANTTIYFLDNDLMMVHSGNKSRNEFTILDTSDPAPAIRKSSEFCK